MKTARFQERGNIEIQDEPIPKPNPHEILVKVKACGICGTDYHVYKGELNDLVKKGTVLGHEFAGEVESIGKEVIGFTEGDRVAIEPNLFCGECYYCRNAKKHFCEKWQAIGLSRDGGFEEYVTVPTSAAYHIPPAMPFETAAFFEPMACVIHGLERAHIKIGDSVVVQGAGSIGQLFIQILNKIGASQIIVSDIDSFKLQLAKKHGATSIINVSQESLEERVKELTQMKGAQVFIDAAGLLSSIPSGLDLLENTGKILIFGVPAEKKTIQISPYEIYRKEIEIIGSFTNPYSNEKALKMLANIDIQDLITNPIQLDDIVTLGFNQMGKSGVIKTQIQF